jgi:hypothetical protein
MTNLWLKLCPEPIRAFIAQRLLSCGVWSALKAAKIWPEGLGGGDG